MNEKESEKKPVYVTQFINKRQQESAQIVFCDRPSGLFLPPNSTFQMESENPLELYSRYSKCSFQRNGDIKLTERAGWKDVEKTLDYGSPYVVKFWNRDGSTWESVYIGGEHNRPFLIPKGIPRFVGVSLDSKFVKYTEWIWQFEIRKKQIEGSGYSTEEWGLQQYGVERDKKELREIAALIKERDMKIATETAERNVNAFIKQRGLV